MDSLDVPLVSKAQDSDSSLSQDLDLAKYTAGLRSLASKIAYKNCILLLDSVSLEP